MSEPKSREDFQKDLERLQSLCEPNDFIMAQFLVDELLEHDDGLRRKVAELEAFIAGVKPRLEIADRAIEMVHAFDSMLIQTPEDRQVPIEELLRRRIAGE